MVILQENLGLPVAPRFSISSHPYPEHPHIHSFISGMHHYECVVPNIETWTSISRVGDSEPYQLLRSGRGSFQVLLGVFIHVACDGGIRWSPLVLLTGSPKLCIFFDAIPLCLLASLLSSSYSLPLTYIS